MRASLALKLRSSVWWSIVQAFGLVALLLLFGFGYRQTAVCVRDTRAELAREVQIGVEQSTPPAPQPCALVRLPNQDRASTPERTYKLSLRESGLETVDRIEYVESGIRVSKGCYTFRLRPVVVMGISSPTNEVRKSGRAVLVRLGAPLPYPHTFVPVVGAWHLYGQIPGMHSLDERFVYDARLNEMVRAPGYDPQRYLTTILNQETVDQSQLARNEAAGMRPCLHMP